MKVDKQTVSYSKQGIHLEIGKKYGAIECPHSHDDEYQFEILLEGTAKNLANKNHEIVIPGYINAYNPGDSHQTCYADTNSFIFHIKLDAMKKMYDEINISQNEPIFNSIMNKQCSVPLPLLKQEIQSLKELQNISLSKASNLYKEDKVLTILKLFLRDLEGNRMAHKLKVVDYYSRQRIIKVKDWLQSNFHHDDITVNKLAGMLHMSPFHFIRTFKQVLGASPYEFLMNIRIDAAIKRLKEKRFRNIDEVSLEVGFRSTSQLRYHIKKIKGYLPSQI